MPQSASVAMPAAASRPPYLIARGRTQRADDGAAADTRERGEALTDDERAHAREDPQTQMGAEIEDAPGGDAALDHRRRAEHGREREQPFVPEAGDGADHRRMIRAGRLRYTAPLYEDRGQHGDDRHTEPDHAPGRAEIEHDARARRAEHRTTVVETVEPYEAGRLGRERVGRDDVHHDVDHAAGGERDDEHGCEQCDARRARSDREEHAPQCQGAGERDTSTPPIGECATERGDRGCGPDAARKEETELCVAETERALDIDRRDRPCATEQSEDQERRGHRPQRRGRGPHALSDVREYAG